MEVTLTRVEVKLDKIVPPLTGDTEVYMGEKLENHGTSQDTVKSPKTSQLPTRLENTRSFAAKQKLKN